MKTNKTLKMETMEILESMIDNDYTMENAITDILDNGCVSGVVGSLIYYYQTEAFFNRHKEEINELAQELSLDIYGDKYSIYHNLNGGCDKNNLSWMAFEETVRQIANELDMEY